MSACIRKFLGVESWLDPRLAVATLLFAYLVLGMTVLGFNRSPAQIAITSVSACALDVLLMAIFRKRVVFPLSALITSFSLSLLLDYSHGYLLPVIPVIFAIGSKYVFTFEGRHVYNPALFGVVASLLCTRELISAAPAYQWNGIGAMAIFLVMPAILFFLPRIRRTPLVLSFLFFFTLQTALRAFLMRYHLPFETLFLGTLTSPAFFLFTFFMITDPATSPADTREQIERGAAIAFVDLLFHIRQSYFTFFYAGFVVQTIVFLARHAKGSMEARDRRATMTAMIGSGRRPALFVTAAAGVFLLLGMVHPHAPAAIVDFTFREMPRAETHVDAHFGDVYQRVDPRVQHVAKWLLSVGDAVAAADYDGDGKPDLFFTMMLMKERNSLYRNLGNFQFERVPIPALDARNAAPETYGLPSGAMFVDYDNDGDLDLFITYAFGSPVLLKNMLRESGTASFADVTAEVGLEHYTNSIAATWLDVNRDGRLDLLITNVLPTTLPDYATPTRLNLFHLPQPQFRGDERMFHFMHDSWNDAANGGQKELFLAGADGRFVRQDARAWGMPETRWSLAVGTADFNHDGWTDVYVANDFGPDDLYFNEGGKRFRAIRGRIFGSIGKDTYKGMNVSTGDLDRNGWEDVYVSDVHHPLQAEGSLAWMFGPDSIRDQATQLGLLNEERFGWGAAIADLNNDGWLDVVQANGMVDDSIDKTSGDCADYWYVNEKIARSAPSIHSYANKWGDIRGMCIFGREQNRVYLNRGDDARPRFADVADEVGVTALTNSRGVAAVDLDNDGRLDLVITHMFQPPTIYRNVARADAKEQWIGFELPAGRSSIGSVVTLRYIDRHGTPVSQMREVTLVNGFSAQSDPRLHFGLGDYGSGLVAEVRWLGGGTSVYRDLRLNSYQPLSVPSPRGAGRGAQG